MPDVDPFQLEDAPEAEWLKAGEEPDVQIPLPPMPGSHESPGVVLFRRVPAGSFLMGERGGLPAHDPVHRVQVGEFWLGKFVVTQAQWRAVARRMKWDETDFDPINPSHFKGDNLPVEQVSWHDVQAWLASWQAWLDEHPGAVSKLNGTGADWSGKVMVRLPCEAEWEYACRAGSRTDFWNGDGEEALRQVGWFYENSGGRTHDVEEGVCAEEPRHPIGLCGMHGNVWEWCADVWHDRAYCKRTWGWTASAWEEGDDADWGRVLRGGSWDILGRNAASGYRYGLRPDDRNVSIGFRPYLFLRSASQPADQREGRGTAGRIKPEPRDGVEAETAGRPELGQVGETENWPAKPAKISGPNLSPPMPRRVVHWPDRNAPDFWDWDKLRAEGVTKLVIQGPLKLNESEVAQLTRGIAALSTLRELYLWSIRDEFSLPDLPPSLRILNLGGCKGLENLGPLPHELQVLDLAGCEKLASFRDLGGPGLRSLFLNGCQRLRSSQLQGILDRSPHLEELDANECHQVTEIESIPLGLRRLMLSHCSGLVRLPDLSDHTALTDLDIRHCTSLTTLPGLPIGQGEGLRRFLAYECGSLRKFRGCDVRPVHLGEPRTSLMDGSATSSNVAATFRTMQRLAGTASDLVMGKVLFLGGGRCGKTTLAKALQWEQMDEEERGKNPKLNPMKYSESTHGIRFWRWQTRFGGAVRHAGEAHLWDFGGQEVYHNTHRMFASEGSVFVIATTSRAGHQERWRQDLDQGESKAEEKPQWDKENEFREVRYWLDYLRSVLGIGTVEEFAGRLRSEAGHRRVWVRIVYTGQARHEEARKELMDQAGPYRDLLERDNGGLRWGVYDRAKTGDEAGSVKPILEWVQDSLGHAADAFGIRTPALFQQMAERVGEEIGKGTRGQRTVNWREWCDWAEQLQPIGEGASARMELRQEQGLAVANFLHQCGRIFLLGPRNLPQRIILNHQWAAKIIYALSKDPNASRWRAKSGCLLQESDIVPLLEETDEYMECPSELKPAFLDLLHDCGVCVRVGDETWMPMQAELLPRQTAVLDEKLVKAWESVRQKWPGSWVNHSFAIHAQDDHLPGPRTGRPRSVRSGSANHTQGGRLLGHADFRAVVRALVEGRHGGLPRALFGGDEDGRGEAQVSSRATRSSVWHWETGLQLELNSSGSTVEEHGVAVVRVEWMPRTGADRKRQFDGGIFVQLLTRDEDRQGARLRKFLKDGPLRAFGDELDDTSDPRPGDLPEADMGCLRGHGQPGWTTLHGPPRPDVQHDVAISYRWRDREIVQPLVEALKREKIHFYIDRQDELGRSHGEDRGSRITELYGYLKRARVLVVVATNEYFAEPRLNPSTNCYCPVELADAVNAHAEGLLGLPSGRAPGNVLWVAGPGFDVNGLRDRIEPLIQGYWDRVIRVRLPKGLRSDGDEWARSEAWSIANANESRVRQFVDEVVGGTDLVSKTETPLWVEEIMDRIRSRIRGTEA